MTPHRPVADPATTTTSARHRSVPVRLLAVLVLDVVLLLAGGVAVLLHPGAASSEPAPLEQATPVRPQMQSMSAEIDPEAAPPRRVTVERLGIDSTLVGLGVQADGTLAVPEDFDTAGWYRAGTAPGDLGPAVLVGHVDSYEGAAVFYRLRELAPGDRVTVERVDGSVVSFEVYGQETVAKDAFPTERVYGPTEGAELRLLTCGGSFDEEAGSYEENVVVYARRVDEPVAA